MFDVDDMVPDVIPNVGYEDDAVVVAFCIKMFRNDLEKYLSAIIKG